MKRLALLVFILLLAPLRGWAQEAKSLPSADERYKADILFVVAHPDDEGAATPYLARALDEGKHVAVAFGTRGSSGANEAGAEQQRLWVQFARSRPDARWQRWALPMSGFWAARTRRARMCCSRWRTGSTERRWNSSCGWCD